MSKYQTATEALMNVDGDDVRLQCGSAWMYWNTGLGEWIVLERKPYARKNTTLYRGTSEADALEILMQ